MGAQNRRVLSISDKAKGLFSAMRTQSPPHIRARPMRSGRVCSCQAVVPSKSTVIMPSPFHFKYAFIIIACAPAVNGKTEKRRPQRIPRRSARIGMRMLDGALPRPQRRRNRNRGSGIFRTRSVYRAPQGKTERMLLHPMRFCSARCASLSKASAVLIAALPCVQPDVRGRPEAAGHRAAAVL